MNRLLDSTQLKKIELLRYLLFHENTAKTQVLAQQWQVSTKTINRYCQSLNEDFYFISTPPIIQLENKMGSIYLNFSEPTAPSYYLDHLIALYAQDSTKVQILGTLLSEKHTNVTNLADKLYLSPTNLYTHLHQLERALIPFELSFNWEKQSQGFNFSYEEKKLRFFSYLFNWYYFKFFPLFPTENAYETFLQLKRNITYQFPNDTSPAKQHQLLYLTYISLWHIEKSNSVLLSDSSADILRFITTIKDYSVALDHPTILASESEKLFFNFFARITLDSLDDYETKFAIVSTLAKQNSSMFQYFQDLHDCLISQFNITATIADTIDFYYSFLLLNLYNQEIGVSLENDTFTKSNFPFYKKDTDVQLNILIIIRTLYEELTKKHDQPLLNKNIAHSIIWFFLAPYLKKSPLILAINFSNNPMGNTIIKNRLLQLFNTDLIQFTELMDSADLIISDCTYLKQNTQEFFYMDSLNDPLCWNLLFEAIQKKLTQQIL